MSVSEDGMICPHADRHRAWAENPLGHYLGQLNVPDSCELCYAAFQYLGCKHPEDYFARCKEWYHEVYLPGLVKSAGVPVNAFGLALRRRRGRAGV